MALGSPALVKERTRAVWVWSAFEQLLQDLRFGFRILTKSPALSATAILLVALVIGGNATVFSMARGILARPSPGVHAGGLLTVSWVAEDGFIETHNAYHVYRHFSERTTTLASIAAHDLRRITLMHDNGSYAVRAGIVSPNYFETLGVRIVKGRSFTADEATRGTFGLVVVISHDLWRTTFQAMDGIAGHAITLNGQPATVVGVAEPDFHGAQMAELADVWLPLAGELPEFLDQGRGSAVAMIGRLAPGRAQREAQVELATLWSQLQAADPSLAVFGLVAQRYRVRLVPYSATAGGNSLVSLFGYRILAIFSVVTLLTVLIVCANVANLLIARAVARQRELALRQSLGASRLRVVRGLIAEGLALSAVAWMAACLFARHRDILNPGGCTRSSFVPFPDARLDGHRLRARPGHALHACGHARSRLQDLAPAAAAVPEGRRTSARRLSFEAFGRTRGDAAGIFGAAAHECRTGLPIVHGRKRYGCRVRHSQRPDGDGEYVRRRRRARREPGPARDAPRADRPDTGGRRRVVRAGQASLAVDQFSGPSRSVQRSDSRGGSADLTRLLQDPWRADDCRQ
jgi:hypothetical protein